MSVKKNLASLLLSLGCATTASAGVMGPVAAPAFTGFYVEGNVGYAYHPWQKDRTTTVGLESQLGVLTNLSNINSGVTGGVDVGYQFMPNFAAEGGWYYIPRASYNRFVTVTLPVAASTFVLPAGLQVNINSGLAYLALKGIMPVYDNVEAFAKFGAAYAYNHTNVAVPASLVDSPTAITVDHSNFWNPLFAVGLQYTAMQNFTVNLQYTNVAGYHAASADHFITPSIQLVTAGLGYKFFC